VCSNHCRLWAASFVGWLIAVLALSACDAVPVTVPDTEAAAAAMRTQVAIGAATMVAAESLAPTGTPMDSVADDGVTLLPSGTPPLAQPSAKQPAASMYATPSTTQGARLRIPSLDIDLPIKEVSWELIEVEGQTVGVWKTAQGAVGHHRGSAAPGAPGNCVLSGHSRQNDGGLLIGIWDLPQGAQIIVSDGAGVEHTYIVNEVSKVQELGASLEQRQANAQAMAPSDDTRLTLITFWPEWAYTHRIVVVALAG